MAEALGHADLPALDHGMTRVDWSYHRNG